MLTLAIAVAAAAPVDRDLDAVVLLRQGSTTCAAVHLGDGRIATAYHCVAPGGRPLLVARSGARAVARIVAVDVAGDLAVLGAPEAGGWPSLALAADLPAQGASVRALGHPYGEDPPSGILAGTLRWSASDGIVAAVGERMLQVTAPLNPGNSGGPVVDEAGRVVGIASRRLGGENLGFAARADRLAALLDRERHPMSPFGGTVAFHGLLTSQTGADTGLAAGARGELAFRDRVVVDVAGFVPFSPRWNAARFGASASVIAESRTGLRQRVGRGTWAARLDAMAGLVAVHRLVAPEGDPFALASATIPSWSLGAAVHVRAAGFEVGFVPELGIARATVILRVPGVVAVY